MPTQNFLEFLIQPLWRKKLDTYKRQKATWKRKHTQLVQKFKDDHAKWKERQKTKKQQYNIQRKVAEKRYRQQREQVIRLREKRNDLVEHFRRCLRAGNPNAICQYLDLFFKGRLYPRGFGVAHLVSMDAPSSTVIVDLELPEVLDVCKVNGFRFTKTTGEINEVPMKPAEFSEFYDSAVKQSVLRTVHEVFAAVTNKVVTAVVVNGWVTHLEVGTGKEETRCIISVSVYREQMDDIDLNRVDPAECIKTLKGLIAGPLSEVAPVRPIMHLSREDDRFVDSRDVLSEMNASTNLAEIGWGKFEHLVRELMGKMFSSDGAEVRVTQCSRDGGVDAIAIDPIRGGKFVIQAKRYTNTVPVSAVRDLYGTMQHEGAVKGILVTTAAFGRDSRKFVEDKPLALIDGTNLVYLLEQHGHKVRIDIEAARRNPDWNPLAR